jgi:hypothetical protein
VSVAQVHGYVLGFGIIGSWLVVMLLSLVLRALAARSTDRDAGSDAGADAEVPWFWRVVSAAQILLGVQLLVGAYLFLAGGRPGPDTFIHVFHPLYGFVFPGIVLVYGHKLAREGRVHPFTAFAVVGLVNFGLTARAFMVAVVG